MSSKSRSNRYEGSSSLGWNGGRKMPARRRSRVIMQNLSVVMRGLVPRIPLNKALCSPKRDGRDKPGHGEFQYVDYKNRVGQFNVRHMCEDGVLSQPSPSLGWRKLRPMMSVNSSSSTFALGSNE